MAEHCGHPVCAYVGKFEVLVACVNLLLIAGDFTVKANVRQKKVKAKCHFTHVCMCVSTCVRLCVCVCFIVVVIVVTLDLVIVIVVVRGVQGGESGGLVDRPGVGL